MRYRVERALAVDGDLELIFDHLADAYSDFGDDRAEAFTRAAHRITGIQDEMEALGRQPHQGTGRPELGPTVRSLSKSRAVFYFEIDDDRTVVRVLAVFFGGQDHTRHMLTRMER